MARRRRRGEVLEVLVQSKRDKHATLKLMRKLLKKYAFVPERLVSDDLRSYAPAASDLGIEHLHECSRCRTVGPRIHINRPDGGSARCSASRAPAPRRNSSQPTHPAQHLRRQMLLTSVQPHRVLRAPAISTWREAVAAARRSVTPLQSARAFHVAT